MRSVSSRRELAEVVRSARADLGLTQQELADRVGVGRLLIVQIESGKANPTLDNMLSLAGALNLDLAVGPRNAQPAHSDHIAQIEEAMARIAKTGRAT